MKTFSPRSLGLFVSLKNLLLTVTLRHKVQKLHVAKQPISCTFLNNRNCQVIVSCWQTEDLKFKGKGILIIYNSLIAWNCWSLCSEEHWILWVYCVSLQCIRNWNNWEQLQLSFSSFAPKLGGEKALFAQGFMMAGQIRLLLTRWGSDEEMHVLALAWTRSASVPLEGKEHDI